MAKPAAPKLKMPRTAPTAPPKPRRTIPVHALADERVHLALAHLGRLRQGVLKILCDKVAVSALSPFALAEKGKRKCPACFRQVDEEGFLAAKDRVAIGESGKEAREPPSKRR